MTVSLCRWWIFAVVLLTTAQTQAAPIQSHDEIRGAVETFLMTQPGAGDPAQRRVEVGQLDPRLRLPACDEALETFLPPGGQSMGRTSVGVRCNAPRPWTLYVPAQISAIGPAVVVNRPLMRGETVSAGDIQLVDRDMAGLPAGFFSSPEDVLGMTLRRPVNAGTVLTGHMVKEPILVHRGEEVTLLASMPGIQVSSSGKALADAAHGERVRVKNLRSNRIVEGRVSAAGTVMVTP